jgi:peptidoglycan/LPS O-acetylase OafA/YrhL
MAITSIGDRLDANKGIGVGFDSLRVALALGVVLWHSFPIVYGKGLAIENNPAWPFVSGILALFFALSGFLVTGSALRLKIGKFALSRALRLIPALAVDTAFSILVVGALATTLPLAEYFSNPGTAHYLLNIVGEIRYELPGVFKTHPMPAVNGALWTIRPELYCYILIGAFIAFGWVKKTWLVTTTAVAVFAALAVWPLLQAAGVPLFITNQYDRLRLVGFFFLGAAAYLHRHRVPYLPWLAVACLALLVFAAVFGSSSWREHTIWLIISAAPFVYLMAFLGVTKLPTLPYFDRGDYSYGIYLYAFPVQQLVLHYVPGAGPITLFFLALPFIFALAAFSWHFVEKPTLKLRKAFSMAAKIEEKREEAHAAPEKHPEVGGEQASLKPATLD